MTKSINTPANSLLAALLVLLPAVAGVVACAGPAGASSYHPSAHSGASMLPLTVLYHGTYSESDLKRLPLVGLLGVQDVMELWYPTTETNDVAVDEAVRAHLDALRLEYRKSRTVELTGFSQGGCLVLDLVGRLQPSELAATSSLLLLSPAFSTYVDLPMTKRMEAHCARAQAHILREIDADPQGELAALIKNRTAIAVATRDGIVRNGMEVLPVSHRYIVEGKHMLWTRGDNHEQVAIRLAQDI